MNPIHHKPHDPRQQVLDTAIQLGLIDRPGSGTPDDATTPTPWPLRLLFGLGGWLVALPMLGMLGLLLIDSFDDFGGLVWGLLLLVPAVLLLRRNPGLFAEQLLVALLVAGSLLCGVSVGGEVSLPAGLATVGALCAVLPWLLPQAWLRSALGAGAATALGLAITSDDDFNLHRQGELGLVWLVLHAWLFIAGIGLRGADGGLGAGEPARWLQRLDDFAQGWMLASLVGLAVFSGMTFLVGGVLDPGDTGSLTWAFMPRWMSWASAALTLCAGAGLAWWAPALRRAWLGGVVLVVAALAWWVPMLGGILCALALLLVTHRPVLAGAAAVAAAWAVGAFYYALVLPLADKALLLVVLALLLLGLAAWGRRDAGVASTAATEEAVSPPAAPPGRSPWRWGMAVTAALVLLLANVGIWQKEQLIRHGEVLFIPLAPADPRSLMQGDFMRLDFVGWNLDREIQDVSSGEDVGLERPHLVLQREAQGIARPVRLDDGIAPLAAGEIRLPLTHKAGQWLLVTDAFFFKEGEAQRWEAARFGEFRMDPSGRALLVTLRGENLAPL